MKHFNALDYVRKAKNFGVSEELPTFQASEFEVISELG